MSTLVHTPYGTSEAAPPLRLLERPARFGPRPVARVAQDAVAPRVPLLQRLAAQVERYWAWGEGLSHHRMGSYQRR